MSNKITYSIELALALTTFFSTLITGGIIVDFIVGISTYTCARLFYYYFGERIKKCISKFKNNEISK